MKHRTMAELTAELDEVRASPSENGVVEMIVVRPKSDERVVLDECQLTATSGADGDLWANDSWMKLPDGNPHPDVQVSVMNSRCIDLITRDRKAWPLAGDNLFVDFDLSEQNLRVGRRVSVGEAVIEVTSQLHTGCEKFAERFGKDAYQFVNGDTGKQLRLRGIFARVIKDGLVRVGDPISNSPAA